MIKTISIVIVAVLLAGCSRNNSSTRIKEKIHDPERQLVIHWSNGPDTQNVIAEGYWLILENGKNVNVSSNDYNSVSVGDIWLK